VTDAELIKASVSVPWSRMCFSICTPRKITKMPIIQESLKPKKKNEKDLKSSEFLKFLMHI
jgi:hypothetical protein